MKSFKLAVPLACLVALAVILGCDGNDQETSTPAPATTSATSPAATGTGVAHQCFYLRTERKHPVGNNDVRVSGGATCADARWLYFNPLRPSDQVRGWTCAQQSLGPVGPTLAFCAHGRNKRASFLYH